MELMAEIKEKTCLWSLPSRITVGGWQEANSTALCPEKGRLLQGQAGQRGKAPRVKKSLKVKPSHLCSSAGHSLPRWVKMDE